MSRLACIAGALLLLMGAARAGETQPAADPPVPATISVGASDHRGFGRIVYEFAPPVRYTLTTEPGRVRLEVQGVPALPTPDRLPRNVRAIRPSGTAIEFDLAQGAQPRVTRLDDRVVVDLLDPPRLQLHPQPATPLRQRADHASPSPLTASPPSVDVPSVSTQAAPPQPSAPEPSPAPAPAPLPATVVDQPTRQPPRASVEQQSPPPAARVATNDAGPISVAALPISAGEPGALLPFPERVGAAAFRRGGRALLVFDTRQPLDLAQLSGNGVLGAAKVELLPAATLVSFPLAADASLRLERAPEGWRVRLGASPSPAQPSMQQTNEGVVFGFADASQAVVVPDPESRAPLLVGTVRPSSGLGSAMAVARRTPSFHVLPAWLGLVVETRSDRVQLSAHTDGFALRVPAALLAPEAPATTVVANAAALTRAFDFPDLPTSALQRRMQASVAAAAAAPPRARLPARLAAAQAMIALGLSAEAQGLLAATRAAEPGGVQEGNAAALQAVAALLDGRSSHAGALDDAHLDGSDEITLWRAIAAALRAAADDETSPAAAAAVAATLPLIVSYPQALREKLLPLAAETLALGGQEKAADALLAAFPSDPALFLAHGLRLEAGGEMEKALALYDQLATARDRLVRVRAGIRAAELRHRTGQLDAAVTADALDRLLIVWRGDQRELSLRLRVAELRTEAGQFRPALDLLRDTQTLFPAARESIKAPMGQVFLALLAGNQAATLKPLDLITLARDFADCVPAGDAGDRLAVVLAARLVALDLPVQAAPVLDRLMQAAPAGASRGQFGLELATMRLEGDDASGALAALRASDAPNLPEALAEQRGLALAHAQAHQGNLSGALSTLSALGTASADELRASLLETAKDWPSALAALRDLAAKRVAPTGPLAPEQQEILLREASAALLAGDQGTLRTLREAAGARIGTGPRADLFRLLTDRAVQSPTDLPRAARDVVLARGMTQDLQSLSAR